MLKFEHIGGQYINHWSFIFSPARPGAKHFACGSMVLYFFMYVVIFPAGQNNDIHRARNPGLSCHRCLLVFAHKHAHQALGK
jgi:hypothetical protein